MDLKEAMRLMLVAHFQATAKHMSSGKGKETSDEEDCASLSLQEAYGKILNDTEDTDSEDLEEAYDKILNDTEDSDNAVVEEEAEDEADVSNGARAKVFNGVPKDLNHKKDEEKQAFKAGALQKKNIPKEILTKPLEKMCDFLKYRARTGNIFSVDYSKGWLRSARLSFKDNQLCLHRLKNKHPPVGSHIVKHSDVMKLDDPSSRVTFITLRDCGCEVFGKVYIQVDVGSIGARQFSNMCTGQLGPSYANTKGVAWFNKKHDKFEFVRMGDCQIVDSTGGAEMFVGIQYGKEEDQSVYRKPWLAGTVEGCWMWEDEIASQFDILLKDNPGRMCEGAIGRVVDGFDRLLKAVKATSYCTEMLELIDCGIVLPC